MRLRYFLFTCFLLIPFAAKASILINEIAWMGTVPKEGETAGVAANNEWIELFNAGNASVSLEGWKIIAEDGAPDILLLGSIPAQGYFLLERTDDNTMYGVTADQIYTGALGNDGEYLKLKDASGIMVDEVNALSGWPAGDNTTKDTMQRSGGNWITAPATPRAPNAGIASGSPAPLPAPVSAPPALHAPSAPVSSFIPLLKAYGGEDIRAAVGTLVEFRGHATNAKNEQVENVRFLWNFGDGETKEGRVVFHIYSIPGKYTVGLSITSAENVASDYHRVEIVSNQITIGDVLEGENGFIRFINPSDIEIDVGGWLVDDGAGMRFAIPSHTKIASHSEIALANQITKLFLAKIIYPATLRFPNATVALQKFPELSVNPLFASSSASLPQILKGEEKIPTKIVATKVASLQEKKEKSNETGKVSELISSSSKDRLAAVSQNTSPRTLFFFSTAFAVSMLSALGFIIFKRFL